MAFSLFVFLVHPFLHDCINYYLYVLSLQSVAEAAEDIWDRYGYDFETDYSGLLKALSHINYNVRLAAAEALAAALDERPDTIQVSLIYQTFDCLSRLLLFNKCLYF